MLAANRENPEGIPVQLTYARPLSKRDQGISVIDSERKTELFWLESVDDLDPKSRTIAVEALDNRYRIAIIKTIIDSHVNHGHRYLKVRTDKGERYFNLREPGKNVTNVTPDHLIIRDSMGNRYEVPSLQALDPDSRDLLDRVL